MAYAINQFGEWDPLTKGNSRSMAKTYFGEGIDLYSNEILLRIASSEDMIDHISFNGVSIVKLVCQLYVLLGGNSVESE